MKIPCFNCRYSRLDKHKYKLVSLKCLEYHKPQKPWLLGKKASCAAYKSSLTNWLKNFYLTYLV